MIVTQIQNSEVQQIDSLIMRNVNAMIGRRISKNIAVVDLLAGYNATVATPITEAEAATNKEFARYTAYQILLYKDRMKAKTAAFCENEDGYTTFTPAEYLHLVLLSDYAKSIDVYLQSDTYHNDFTEIGSYETVPFWQTSGASFSLTETSAISATLPEVEDYPGVNRNYILGVMFDRDACGIINERRNVAVSYNNRGRYWNNFYQVETRLFTDPAENCIVFVLGDGEIPDIIHNGEYRASGVESVSLRELLLISPMEAEIVTAESSDTSIATIASTNVVFTGTPGECDITATVRYNGVDRTGNCHVTIR